MKFWIRFIAICIAGGILGFWRQTIGESVYVDYYGRIVSIAVGSLTFGLTFIAVYFATRRKSEGFSDFLICLTGAIFTFINLNILKDAIELRIAWNDLSLQSLVRDVEHSISRDGFIGRFLFGIIIYFCGSFLFVWVVKLLVRLVKRRFE